MNVIRLKYQIKAYYKEHMDMTFWYDIFSFFAFGGLPDVLRGYSWLVLRDYSWQSCEARDAGLKIVPPAHKAHTGLL